MKPCPECKSENVYKYKKSRWANGGYGPVLLPDLQPNFFTVAKLTSVVCADCGYIRFYADDKTRKKLATAKNWERDC